MTGALDDAGERRVKLHHHGQLDAAHIQCRKKQGDEGDRGEPESCEHHYQQPQIAVAAGDRRDKAVVYAAHLESARQAGQGPGDENRNQHITLRRQAE